MVVQVTPFRGSNPLRAIATGEDIVDRRRQIANAEANTQLRGAELEQRQAGLDQKAAELQQEQARALSEMAVNAFDNAVAKAKTPQEAEAILRSRDELAVRQGLVNEPVFGPSDYALLYKLPESQFGKGGTVDLLKGMSTQIVDAEGPGIATNIINPQTGESTLSIARLPTGASFTSRLGETASEQTDRRVGEASRSAAAKDQQGRLGDAITEGQLAADSTASIRRAIALLDSGVDTDALSRAQLAFMRSLGIEDPASGELSNLLGKAVLSQLRGTFGAAFTVEEVRRLVAIEASFGRNPATNRRLLNNALGLAERTATRGINAAIEQGDDFSAQQIRQALEFTVQEEPTIPTVTTQEQFDALPSGAIYIEDGEKYRKP